MTSNGVETTSTMCETPLVGYTSTVKRSLVFLSAPRRGFPSGFISATLVKARWGDGHLGDSQQLLPRSQKGKGLSLQNVCHGGR